MDPKVNVWAELMRLDEGRCRYCRTTERLSLDHVIPLYHGGPHKLWNYTLACRRCNSAKQHRFNEVAAQTLIENVTHCFVERSVSVGWGHGDWYEERKAQASVR